MDEKRNNRSVERRLKESRCKHDRARIQVGRISHFGLLEMSRAAHPHQRAGKLDRQVPALRRQRACPLGRPRSPYRCCARSRRRCKRGGTHSSCIVRTRSDIAIYVLNHKRAHLRELEERFRITITINADAAMGGQTPFMIERGELVHSAEQARAFGRPAGAGAGGRARGRPGRRPPAEAEAEAEDGKSKARPTPKARRTTPRATSSPKPRRAKARAATMVARRATASAGAAGGGGAVGAAKAARADRSPPRPLPKARAHVTTARAARRPKRPDPDGSRRSDDMPAAAGEPREPGPQDGNGDGGPAPAARTHRGGPTAPPRPRGREERYSPRTPRRDMHGTARASGARRARRGPSPNPADASPISSGPPIAHEARRTGTRRRPDPQPRAPARRPETSACRAGGGQAATPALDRAQSPCPLLVRRHRRLTERSRRRRNRPAPPPSSGTGSRAAPEQPHQDEEAGKPRRAAAGGVSAFSVAEAGAGAFSGEVGVQFTVESDQAV